MVFLSLQLAGERRDTSSQPVLVDVDQVEAVIPYRYLRNGYVPEEGSTVVTRSGERIHVAETAGQVQELLVKAAEGG